MACKKNITNTCSSSNSGGTIDPGVTDGDYLVSNITVAGGNITDISANYDDSIKNLNIWNNTPLSKDNTVMIGNNSGSGIDNNSTVVGSNNNIEGTQAEQGQCVFGFQNDIGDPSVAISQKNCVFGNQNTVQRSGLNGGNRLTDFNVVCGNFNQIEDGVNNILIGNNCDVASNNPGNNCLLIGNSATSDTGVNDQIVIGSSSTPYSSMKIHTLPSSTGGNPLYYNNSTGEIYENSSGGGGGGALQYAADSITISSTGILTETIGFQPKTIKFYYDPDLTNYGNIRFATGVANNTFTFYESWDQSSSQMTSGMFVIGITGYVIFVSDGTNDLSVLCNSITATGFTLNIGSFTGWASGDPVIKYEAFG